jgi:hypothetical protein
LINATTDYGNRAENEFEAYFREAQNATMTLSDLHRNSEYGFGPIRELEHSPRARELLNKHLDEMRILIKQVTPAASAILKKELHVRYQIDL